jgi:hypothetical protein
MGRRNVARLSVGQESATGVKHAEARSHGGHSFKYQCRLAALAFRNAFSVSPCVFHLEVERSTGSSRSTGVGLPSRSSMTR